MNSTRRWQSLPAIEAAAAATSAIPVTASVWRPPRRGGAAGAPVAGADGTARRARLIGPAPCAPRRCCAAASGRPGGDSYLLRHVPAEQAVRPERQNQDHQREQPDLAPLRLPEVDQRFEQP